MKTFYKSGFWLVLALLCQDAVGQQRAFKKQALLMGSAFEFTIVADISEDSAEVILGQCIEKVSTIERNISSWDKTSIVSELISHAGIDTLEVNAEVHRLISRAITISELTQGAFDITFNNQNDWIFDQREYTKKILRPSKPPFSFDDIQIIDDNKVFLSKEEMKIGFGGIGKGYAADEVKKMLVSLGINNGVVNASGDLNAWGQNVNGKKWKVGIADPNERKEVLMWIPLTNTAVATSGDYEKYFTSGGKRYAHIINPKTGLPCSGIKSTTVICQKAELSDALATALFVLGPKVGIDLIDQLPGIECIMIDELNGVHFSSGFEGN